MGTWRQKSLFSLILVVCFHYSDANGCSIDGSPPPSVWISGSFIDVDSGEIFNKAVTNVDRIIGISHDNTMVNNEPYVRVYLDGSRFIMETTEEWKKYEEYETVALMRPTVTLGCSDGSTEILINFFINVQDTNNNPPLFKRRDEKDDFVYTIATPVPPGFEITGCLGDLTVRDIDLTTVRIDFAIQENAYFEIEYDADSSNTVKEFKALLRTKALIRNIPDPIVLKINATDVEGTGYPRTSETEITIIGNREFELPEEPVFSETFYLADYREDLDELVLNKPISLQTGYHELVQFYIEGEFSRNFELVPNPEQPNESSIRVVTHLEDDVLLEHSIHLIVRADREHTSGASTTVIVQLPQVVPLEFENAHYEGKIEDNKLEISPLVLRQGYEGTSVSATVLTDYASYFTASVQGNIVTLSMTSLDESIINENSLLNLQIVASTARSTATTIVTLEIIKDDNVTPVFNKPVYMGSYDPDTGLTLERIVFVQGHDGIESLDLTGEYDTYFKSTLTGNVVTIEVSTIPPEAYSRGHLVLSLEAKKPRTVGATAAITITLPADDSNNVVLRFDRVTYQGSIENDVARIGPITLLGGDTGDVVFTLYGDLARYFITSRQGAVVNVAIRTPIPASEIPANRIILLDIRASASEAISAYASLVFEVVVEDDTPPQIELAFDAPFYTGSYTTASGLTMDTRIALLEGHDASVDYALHGEHAQWFTVVPQSDHVTLQVRSAIPEAVLTSIRQLVFVITAQKPGATTAQATIVVSLADNDSSEDSRLGFDRVTYQGSIENDVARIGPITLLGGDTADVVFTLYGDLARYFITSRQGAVVNVAIRTPIPASEIPVNRIILLDIRASASEAISAYASLVLEVVVEDDTPPQIELAFDAPFYTGSYTTASGLTMDTRIALLEGHDASVDYALHGEHAQWFTVVPQSDHVTLQVRSAIPEAVLTSIRQLVFVITAQKPGATTAQATIVVSLADNDSSEDSRLGFDRVTYQGSIENDVARIGPITLLGGDTADVVFTLYGDLARYFITSRQGAVVNVAIRTPIPASEIPANRIILLDIRASASEAISAYASLVLEVVVEDDTPPQIELAFDAPFYTGSYTTASGLTMDTRIALLEGHDASVDYALHGEHAQWFTVVPQSDHVTLQVRSAIPEAVLTSIRQLVFVITAQKPGATTAQATIVVSLADNDSSEDSHLGFDRVTYQGSIENDVARIGPITLLGGDTGDVVFTLYGDLARYFISSRQGAVVNVAIRTPIPASEIPANRIILLDIRASASEAISAYASLVFEVVVEDDTPPQIELAFDAPFYTGSYTTASGLTMDTRIALLEGHDASVDYALHGEHAQWFTVVPQSDHVTLQVRSAIPEAVLTSIRQLVFVITAQKPGATTAQATIVVSLADNDSSEDSRLGFDRVTYQGSIENDVARIGPITLLGGDTGDVVFTLYGDLARYFITSRQGAVVNVAIRMPIPASEIPANRIILLDIRASASEAISAYASLVFEVVVEDDTPPQIELAFDAPFYTGSYTTASGLTMDTRIALLEGHDASVDYALHGEHAQWFTVVPQSDHVTLQVRSAIPEAVLTSIRQLVFVITAQKPGATTAQATIVVSLADNESSEDSRLGFDRVTYQGSIENDVARIGPITLLGGDTGDVVFTLYGDLARYFITSRQGAVVNVAIRTPIPASEIPANRIILLDIRASAFEAISAYASLVFEVVVEDDTPPQIELAFDAPFYTGSYTTASGLTMDTRIALLEGHDASVDYALHGEHAQWFTVVPQSDHVTLQVRSAIPEAVLTSIRQLVFVITAQKPGATTAQATIVVSLADNDSSEDSRLGFDRVTYQGSIENDVARIGPITLLGGDTADVVFTLYGDLARYFITSRQGAVVNVAIRTPIPASEIPVNRIILLDIRASASEAISAYASLVLEVVVEDDTPPQIELAFDAPFYTGSYTTASGLTMDTRIALLEGHDASVDYALHGEHAQWFTVVPQSDHVTLQVRSAIPEAVLTSIRQLVFVITAQKPGATTAQATIVVSLADNESSEDSRLGFDRVTYQGSIENDVARIGPITLLGGDTGDVVFTLYGDLARYFITSRQGAVVNVAIRTPIPASEIPANRIILLDIRASASEAISTYASLVFEVVVEDDTPPQIELAFDAPFYTGSYTTASGLTMDTRIALLEGHDASVDYALHGEHAQWFTVVPQSDHVTLQVRSAIPEAVLTSIRQLVFVITAQKPGATTAQATIVVSLADNESSEDSRLGFDRVTYQGSIENDVARIGPITLLGGDTGDVVFTLYGDLARYFITSRQGAVVNVAIRTPIPASEIPANRIILLDIRASASEAISAYASLVFEVVVEDDTPPQIELAFDAPFYTGSYTTASGLTMDTRIALLEGHDASVDYALHGEHAQWFTVVPQSDHVTLQVRSAIPDAVLTSIRQLVFFITAQKPGATTAEATIVVSLADNDSQTGDDVSFDKVLYEGVVRFNEILHEVITISDYDGTSLDLFGEYSNLFVASVSNGVVSVQAASSLNLPTDVTSLALELHAAGARAVLLLNVLQLDEPILPSVTFSSQSYALSVGAAQTGLVGRVSATADNGETLTYSIGIDNAHLQSRISISNEGELHLSAPADTGIYIFQVIATTVITRVTATATVNLRVEAVTVCDDKGIVVPPLIILDRDEEQAHNNLVVLDSAQQNGCHFTLTNRWPADQTWLYVDEHGLHTTAIDREHESIAFMALSQVQVELLLHCPSDDTTRTKRSDTSDWLGPYDYGRKKWLLTDSIPYNSRRSLVNLIVNDINDNHPIFIGKEHEPIAVGYPTAELEERILPRSLVELKATDADVGENAALMYWSSESVLAVSPTTGFVHVRSGARVQHDQLLTVTVTDRRGQPNGLSGTITLMVKLLDLNHIAVVTIRNAFLDDEVAILAQLSDTIGYEVKTLRSVVISNEIDEDVTRNKRETDSLSASLQLYVYGINAREPVTVDRLAADINANSAIVGVASTIPLEEHLADINILERDVGLLVATIVLSVLLFLLILLIAIWYFLKWRKNRNHSELLDEDSLTSRNASLGEIPKPEPIKPRLNIEDLKKSEKRLQDMLSAPIKEVTVEPMTRRRESPVEAILDLPIVEHNAPIVIQSIDKLKDAEDDSSDDEFGEISKNRRKSVVTFNENVEKIIHMEDNVDDGDPDENDIGDGSQSEVYRL